MNLLTRVLWERILKIGRKVTPSMRVCSLHFIKDDYYVFTRPDCPAGARFLKKTSVPSVNLPLSSVETTNVSNNKITERQIRLENRQKNIKLNAKEKDTECNCFLTEGDNIAVQNDTFLVEEVSIEEKSSDVPQKKILIDVGMQVKSGDLIEKCFLHFLKTDKELSTATGIQNFELFDSIVAAVKIAAPHLNTGVLSIRERVLMTFMKLKQNLSYSFLSILFPTISVRYCSEIICNMLDILSEILEPCIHFPSGDEILRNMPLCFANYPDTRIILDCTKIEIQRPKNLCCQITMYSTYKRRYTIKFMKGVTPGGIISFVSKAYGGRASDKAIFEQSLLLQRLKKGVSVMVDKGFLIDKLCCDYDVKLIRPPFLKDKVQFSENDAVENADIASARVHVERLNQRLKVFEILGSKMSSCLVPKSEKIITILCAVVNLSSPIFKDDKFHS
ncbi:uncharacterized protein LOC143905551 [Temnothorax americanus]|uniref:uncharacterized protein LOC143905551 n=1 Tax=Temnothorax americanus TaxID=1964332 RepID=UPI004067A129